MTGDRSQPGEFDLIASVFAPLTDGDERALGLLDDAAVLPQTEGQDTVVTTDTMVAGVHFLNIETADVVARRLLRVNLSDLASMGAVPVAYFLNLTVPAEIDESWIRLFAEGLRADHDAFGVRLLGGDTTHSDGPVTLTVTILGNVDSGSAIRRSGARPGDDIYVSGTIGDATLGLQRLQAGADMEDFLVARFQRPEPRVQLGVALLGLASAMADVSDGLASDLGHICQASNVGADVSSEDIPLSESARDSLARGDADFADLLSGGDDYELVFTASPDAADRVVDVARSAQVAVSRIGRVRGDSAEVEIRDRDGRQLSLKSPGYRHF